MRVLEVPHRTERPTAQRADGEDSEEPTAAPEWRQQRQGARLPGNPAWPRCCQPLWAQRLAAEREHAGERQRSSCDREQRCDAERACEQYGRETAQDLAKGAAGDDGRVQTLGLARIEESAERDPEQQIDRGLDLFR